jgi:hypothetical protein
MKNMKNMNELNFNKIDWNKIKNQEKETKLKKEIEETKNRFY